ncbi:hypothetical protein [Thioclava sp.]|uniref:hypothetical protein n=1 Tax=Thioclava sp. TaxID=1933450 RepID=UPI003242403E
MKILGVFLILAGIVCFAVAVTGLFAWITPVPADASLSIESMANSIGAQLRLLYGAGTVCIICGAVALWLGIRKSRERKRRGTKAGFRKLITVSLVAVALLACGVFAIFKVMTRWDPDEEWAAKIIEESADLRSLLGEYRDENGEFPFSLDEIAEDYTKPTNYLSRQLAAPDTDRWFYDRIGKDDYQLFVTADSWVSYFDAMVYRHKGEFADPWFATLESSDSKEFGRWRYARGFSEFHEKYYFDADGNIHSNYP